MAKHRKRVPILRRLATWGLCLSTVVTLLIAFLSQPRAVSTSLEISVPPQVDVETSTTQPTPMSPTRTKIKRPRNQAQRLSPKIEKDQVVTPADPPSIKPVRTSAPRPRQTSVRSATPRSSPQQVVPQRLPKTTLPKKKETTKSPSSTLASASKAITKTTTTTKTTTVARVVPPSPSPRPKPQTVAPPPSPSTKPVVTSNSKCGSIGLLPTPKAACNQILAAFPEVKTVLGVGGRAGNPTSCHPKGLAIDLIVGSNKALGDRLYAYVIARRSALGATPVVLWQVPDHFDHVHISFAPCKG